MRKLSRLGVVFISVGVLFVSLFILVSFSSQPPLATDTLHVGNIGWGPSRADPVRAYDEASQELLLNVYDTLIAFKGEVHWDFVPLLATNVPNRTDVSKNITSTDLNPNNPTGSNWSDGSFCVGWKDTDAGGTLSANDVLYMVEPDTSYRTWFVQTVDMAYPVNVTLWRASYTFRIRTSPAISFVNETGQMVDTFDVSDAEYSFKRGLVQDQIGSSVWMFYKPFFGQMNSDPFNSNITEPTAMTFAHLIDNAVETNGSDLTMNIGVPFPDFGFKQIISQTWSSIVSKEFSTSIGCWNEDLYADGDADGFPDWWDSGLVRRKSLSPYDATGAYRYVGTGPYRVSLFDPVNRVVNLTRNALYWRGWPAQVIWSDALKCKSFLETITIEYISDWSTRKDAFTSGEIDVCEVPRANMFELLDPVIKEPADPKIKTIKQIVPSLSMDAVQFTFIVNPSSTFIGTGHFPDGIPPDFFNNTHVRKAFAYSLNTTQYTWQTYFGEADYRKNWLLLMFLDYRDYYNESILGYDMNYSAAEAELQQAVVEGQNVWDSGFNLTMSYNSGSDDRRMACEMIRGFFSTLSTYGGRSGPPFVVNVGDRRGHVSGQV